jgi:hypothetical protein
VVVRMIYLQFFADISLAPSMQFITVSDDLYRCVIIFNICLGVYSLCICNTHIRSARNVDVVALLVMTYNDMINVIVYEIISSNRTRERDREKER